MFFFHTHLSLLFFSSFLWRRSFSLFVALAGSSPSLSYNCKFVTDSLPQNLDPNNTRSRKCRKYSNHESALVSFLWNLFLLFTEILWNKTAKIQNCYFQHDRKVTKNGTVKLDWNLLEIEKKGQKKQRKYCTINDKE